MSEKFEKLKKHILSVSVSCDFQIAKLEWELKDFELVEDWDNCPCGKAIKELCHIKNKTNGNMTYVGNVCINQFIGIDTGNLFDGIKRLKKDPMNAKPNKDLITHAQKCGYIYKQEPKFLLDICRKRNLSASQLSWLRNINRRILQKIVVEKSNIKI